MSEVIEQLTLGAEIDRLYKLRDQIGELKDQLKEMEAVYSARENALAERLDAEGTARATGRLATASISYTVVPQVEDWQAFWDFIHRTKKYELLERRAAARPYRELLEQRKKAIPGVVPFTKRKLNLRTV